MISSLNMLCSHSYLDMLTSHYGIGVILPRCTMYISLYIPHVFHILYTYRLFVNIERLDLRLRAFEMRRFGKSETTNTHIHYFYMTTSYVFLHCEDSPRCIHVAARIPFSHFHFEWNFIVFSFNYDAMRDHTFSIIFLHGACRIVPHIYLIY